MYSLLRNELVQTAEIVVVKVGTNVLSRPDGLLNTERIDILCEEINRVHELGKKIILVSSGAVGAG
ncbi:MAG: glutamate 5-kinase, partial [Thermoguttaceae bacterium]